VCQLSAEPAQEVVERIASNGVERMTSNTVKRMTSNVCVSVEC